MAYSRRGARPVENEETVLQLIEERLDAKINRDYSTADSIRSRLVDEFNVELDDRRRLFRAQVPKGSSRWCKYPSDEQFDASFAHCADEQSKVFNLIEERIAARSKMNYARGDEIQLQLCNDYGVYLDDYKKTYSTITYPYKRRQTKKEEFIVEDPDAPFDQEAVLELIRVRFDAKYKMNFRLADKARDEIMFTWGCEVDDKKKTWARTKGVDMASEVHLKRFNSREEGRRKERRDSGKARRSFSSLSSSKANEWSDIFSKNSSQDDNDNLEDGKNSNEDDDLEKAHALRQNQILKQCKVLHEKLMDLNEKTTGPLQTDTDTSTSMPFVFLLGNHSSGKSSFLNYVTERPVQTAGVAPTDDCFTVVTPGAQDSDQDGPALCSHPDLGFKGLKIFGPNLVHHTQLKVRENVRNDNFMMVDSPGMIGECVGGGVEWSGVEWSGVEWRGEEWRGEERCELVTISL